MDETTKWLRFQVDKEVYGTLVALAKQDDRELPVFLRRHVEKQFGWKEPNEKWPVMPGVAGCHCSPNSGTIPCGYCQEVYKDVQRPCGCIGLRASCNKCDPSMLSLRQVSPQETAQEVQSCLRDISGAVGGMCNCPKCGPH